MKTLFIFLPIRDYIKTRRKLWRQYIIPLAAGIFVLIGAFAIDVRDGVDIEAIFSDFVGFAVTQNLKTSKFVMENAVFQAFSCVRKVSYKMAHFNQCVFLNAYFVGYDGMCYANVFDLLEG